MILATILLSFLVGAEAPKKTDIPPATPGQIYGKLNVHEPTKITLDESVKNFKKYKGKYIQVEGKVVDVCKMAGCWAMITDGKNNVRISFKDYGFFVPRESIGKTVMAEGFIEEGELNVKQHKHYLQEQERPQAEIDKVDKPMKIMKLYAGGLKVL